MAPGEGDLADRLADLRLRLDYPPGVMAGVLQLPSLDPVLDEVESQLDAGGADGLDAAVARELEALAALLLTGMLGTSPDAVQRRIRVIDLLRRADLGKLPIALPDIEDPFGAELRAMLETDDDLRRDLGLFFPLIARATSVSPPERWVRDAAALLGAAGDRQALIAAARRVLAALVRADIVSRPDILVGGLRLANQRFARGLLWFIASSTDEAAPVLEAVGLRMGTSGRRDAVVRDTALANTAAALLGESDDPAAAVALASMRLEITNRNVLRQVDRALAAMAARAGLTVDDLVDASLPTFGLDGAGRLEVEAGAATASIEVRPDGRVDVLWHLAGSVTTTPPASIEVAAPGAVAEAGAQADRIAAAVAEEGRRLELRLSSERAWSIDRWRSRFGDHPIARIHARTLVWRVGRGRAARAALPIDGSWIGVDEEPLIVAEGDEVQLWHPAEAGPAEIAAWRATLASRNVSQAVRQADREVFVPMASGSSRVADLRFAGRIVDQPRLRALLRQRGWAVPALGAWDQGDEATAWRDFGSGFRAELRYQAPGRTPTGERVARARIVAVRFVQTTPSTVPRTADGIPVALAEVPRRMFSEALRDVSLAVSV
ncbi:MAG TPA: DUF4132 domain-containing protein [Patescibacteria group bacterium]|nr:DUF4132 domain-containing protein [Patescibacteria group bacterium]